MEEADRGISPFVIVLRDFANAPDRARRQVASAAAPAIHQESFDDPFASHVPPVIARTIIDAAVTPVVRRGNPR